MLHSVQHALISCRRLRAGHLWWSELHANSRHVRSAQQGQTDLPYWSVPHVLRQGRRLHSGRGLRCGHPEETEGRECELLSPPLSAFLNVTMLGWDEGRSGWRIHQPKAKRITFHSYYHILVHGLFACCLIPPPSLSCTLV